MLSVRLITKLSGLRQCVLNGHKAKDLFKIMMTCEDLWMQAYVNIQGNKGAMTKGVDNTTVDGFSDEYARAIIMKLRDGRFKFSPVRRVFIPKANGKTRPLGIPRFEDKLVQEVIRILLESIYEPIFSKHSHGFRPKRACHTALNEVSKWAGTSWFVEFDIKGYFDNIDHEILVRMLEEKIDDRRFIKLVKLLLTAGYCEDWKFNKTYSGTPQGGVISPLFANIYLHKLDMFLQKWKERYEFGKVKKGKEKNPEVGRINGRMNNINKSILLIDKKLKDGKIVVMSKGPRPKSLAGVKINPNGQDYYFTEDDIVELRRKRELLISEKQKLAAAIRQIPSVIEDDENFRRFHFVRYADDFLVGIIGTKKEAEEILEGVRNFLQEELKLELSEEKSSVKNARADGTRFLSYDIRKSNNLSNVTVKRGGKKHKQKLSGVAIIFEVPKEKVNKFASKYGTLEPMKSLHVVPRIDDADAEILLAFNQEFRGFAQYYAMAHDVKTKLNKLQWLVESSLLKTLARKHKTSVGKITAKHKHKGEVKVVLNKKEYTFFRLKTLKKPSWINQDQLPSGHHFHWKRTNLEERIAANKCEYCDKQDGYFEVHHIRKLKDVSKQKNGWQKQMIAMRRKTLVLCVECHDLLHAGRLPDKRQLTAEV